LKPILPGATIGVLGSGQLGRMFAIAARRMGYRVHTYSPDTDTPTGQVADVEVTGAYEDLDEVRKFAKNVAAVTFEFENVPADTAAAAAEHTEVRPAGNVLHITQNRLREKTFLANSGLPVTHFSSVNSLDELEKALVKQKPPCILKTEGFGYDGKGQYRIHNAADAVAAWEALGGAPAVLESFVEFDFEMSVVAARGADGQFVHYGVVRNEHQNGVLDVTVAPAKVDSRVEREAIDITRNVLKKLDVVGVLCVEFFLTRGGHVFINELAPRPHNSGHFTFDASVTSQSEQQLRAVCGLPLGATNLMQPAAMANLLGDVWSNGEPNWAGALAQPGVKLHLYGKSEPRPGRKMGHLTALGENAESRVREARSRL
jgi:5-(carboxyamino)imidazole ribonucleotide synthase